MSNSFWIVSLAFYYTFGNAKAQVPSIKEHKNFPAISRDGKNIVVLVVDQADYGNEKPTVFQIRDANTGKVEMLYEFPKKQDNSALESALVHSLTSGGYSTIPKLKGTYVDRAYVAKSDDFTFTAKEEYVVIERAGKMILKRKIPKGTLSGACCGDFENQKTKCPVSPSYFGVWCSAEKSIAVVNYSYSGARDGCEGIDQYETIGLPK